MKAVLALVFAVCLLSGVESQTWKQTQKNFGKLVLGVSCISDDHCWVSGQSKSQENAVWQTTDSGSTWVPCDMNKVAVFFLSCSADNASEVIATGYGFRDFGEGSGYSLDGQYFSKTTGDKVCQSQDSGHVDSGEFYRVGHWSHSSTEGKKKGNGVSWSSNKGESYDHFDWGQSSHIRYCSFLDRNYGFCTGGVFPVSDDDEVAEIHAALDLAEGETYQRLNMRTVLGSNGNKATVPVRVPQGGPYFEGDIALTTDGGQTWTNQFHNKGYNNSDAFYFNEIDCINKYDCVAVAEGYDAEGNQDAYVFQTNDGGQHWNKTYTFHDGSLIGVQYIGQKIWIFGGTVSSHEGQVRYSEDNGKTYTVQASFPNSYMMNADMVDETHGYATGEAGAGQLGAIWQFN